MNRSTSEIAARVPVVVGALCWLASFLFSGAALAQVSPATCGNPFKNHFGPWDYRTARRADIEIVEKAHFTPGVESLTKPATTTYGKMASDVSYTLHVFPNHHRALISMIRLGERYNADQPPGASYIVECYLDRATRFRPDDTVVLTLYAQYLGKNKRKDEAIAKLGMALHYADDKPITHYSIGAAFLELGEYDRALVEAHKAKELGIPWMELEDALKAAGRWKEPEKH